MNQPPERLPQLPETDEGYDEAEQRKLDAMSNAEWEAALAESRMISRMFLRGLK